MKKITAMLLAFLFTITCTACSKKTPAEPQIAEMTKICELSTIECHYHNVAKFNQKDAEKFFVFWTKDKRFWIEYSAIVTLGVDVSKIDIKISGSKIKVSLPEAEILDCKVDSETLTEDSYIVDKDSADIEAIDQTEAFSQAEKQLKEEILKDETVLKAAQDRAKELLEKYIESIEEHSDTDYSIEWKYI